MRPGHTLRSASRRCAATARVCGLVLAGAATAQAGMLSVDPGQFTVLSAGSLSFDTNVQITGHVGAGGSVWLAQNGLVTGDVLTTSSFSTGSKMAIGGRVVASGSIWLANNATASSLDTAAGADLGNNSSVVGHIHSGGSVSISNNASVGGDVSYGTSYWAAKNADVAGPVGKNTSEVDVWVPTYRSTPTFTAGSGSSYYQRGSETTLAAGAYGQLSFDRDATVHLGSGDYDIKSMWLGQGARIVVDTTHGDVSINLADSFNSSADVVIEKIGDGQVTIQSGGTMYFGQRNTVSANVLAFGNSFSADTASTFDGFIYSAGSLWLGRDTVVTGSSVGPIVPEPATLLFFLSGSALLGLGSRRFRLS